MGIRFPRNAAYSRDVPLVATAIFLSTYVVLELHPEILRGRWLANVGYVQGLSKLEHHNNHCRRRNATAGNQLQLCLVLCYARSSRRLGNSSIQYDSSIGRLGGYAIFRLLVHGERLTGQLHRPDYSDAAAQRASCFCHQFCSSGAGEPARYAVCDERYKPPCRHGYKVQWCRVLIDSDNELGRDVPVGGA